MVRKLKIYLDSSVPSAYFDETKPERQKETHEFWCKLNYYDVYVSDLVTIEIQRTPDENRKKELLKIIDTFEVLSFKKDEIEELTQSYVREGAVAILEDAIHIAVAVVYGLDIIVSWNFRHIVNLRTKRMNGYGEIEIVDPSML